MALPVPIYAVAAMRGESEDEISATIAVMERMRRIVQS
jgi:hypothetical protein